MIYEDENDSLLEGLFLLFQVYAILSERDAHSLIWNRFSKSRHGREGNIPLVLAMEHYNNFLSVIRNLGPNATNTRAVDRFCKALTVNKKMLENCDYSCNALRRSGKHIKANISGDLKKIVGELIKNSALQVIPGRKYSSYAGVKPSLLEDFDIHAMYKWIQDHKSLVKLIAELCSFNIFHFEVTFQMTMKLDCKVCLFLLRRNFPLLIFRKILFKGCFVENRGPGIFAAV